MTELMTAIAEIVRSAGGVMRGAFTATDKPAYSLCLLYTSDAADERSSVDLGGRRIIKKKKQCYSQCLHAILV